MMSISDGCVCGAAHSVQIDVVVIGEDAMEQLGTYVRKRRWSKPLVIMDANTEEAAGSAWSTNCREPRCVSPHVGFPSGAASLPTNPRCRASRRE